MFTLHVSCDMESHRHTDLPISSPSAISVVSFKAMAVSDVYVFMIM